MRKPNIQISLLFLLAVGAFCKTLDCLDNEGHKIPWFFDYKYPGNVSTASPKHAYIDAKSENEFEILNGYVDADGQALSNTIKLINTFQDLSLIAFNDEPPSEPWVPDGAHAKGFIAFDEVSQTGVYVMHSAPKFPNVSIDGKINTSLPSNSRVYGQNFMCSTFDADGLEKIIQHLEVIYPIFYYRSGVFAKYSFRNSTVNSSVSNYYFGDGEEAWILSKSPNYTDGFLYENIIEPYFNLGFEVESWGRPYQDPVCGKLDSLNVDYVKFISGDGWNHYSDHSKWAVSISSSNKIACSCDMNRMDSQALRGGSCICTKNPILNKGLRAIINQVDTCQNETSIDM